MLGALAPAAVAQVQVDDRVRQGAAGSSDLFLDQIRRDDCAAERKFPAPRLAAMIAPEDWARLCRGLIATAGKTPRFAVQGTTFRADGNLLAAADFSRPARRLDPLIRGFLLWDVIDAGQIGRLRFEQNVRPRGMFRDMPVGAAAQTMVDWRCPVDLIESMRRVQLRSR